MSSKPFLLKKDRGPDSEGLLKWIFCMNMF